MSASKKTVDPIFAEYTRTAPLLDLLFYIEHADTHTAEYSAESLAIMADMRALAETLRGPKPGSTASQKRLVWTLIARFKSSYWGYGQAGWNIARAERIDTAAINAAGEAYEQDCNAAADDASEAA